MKTKLFLHMGPGYHAEVERKLLEPLYPEVDFWNQPHVQSFDKLVEAVCDKVSDLAKASKKPVILIGHSFGGTLADQAVRQIPDKVSEVRLLNSASDPFECFINLGGHLFPKEKHDYQSLRQAPVSEKIQYMIEVASAPAFPSLYWHSKERWAELESILKTVPPLDPGNFISIFTSFLEQKMAKNSLSTSVANKGVIYYSRHDVLINRVKDIEPWASHFPTAQIIELPLGGHHPHLEDVLGTTALFK